MDRGLVTARIHQSPIRTPLNTHRYLVPASLIGGGLRGVRNPDQCPHLHHRTTIDKVARVPRNASRPAQAYLQINLKQGAHSARPKNINSLGCLSDHSQHSFRLSLSHRPCARVLTPSLSMNSCSTVAFIWSPRQLLQSDTGVPHFALDPLTYRCLLSLSPAADFAEPRPPRHSRQLVHSMPRRLGAVIKNHGGHTKY